MATIAPSAGIAGSDDRFPAPEFAETVLGPGFAHAQAHHLGHLLQLHRAHGVMLAEQKLLTRAEIGALLQALDETERRAVERVVSKKGQTMVSIAKQHKMTSKQLAWYNPKVAKLKSGALRVGQTILVPRSDVVALARDVPNPSVERYPSRTSGVRRHKVASGQTLGVIAKRYGTSVATLKRLNGLKGDKLVPGQMLVVSGRAATARPSAKPKAKSGATKSATSSVKPKPKSSAKPKAR